MCLRRKQGWLEWLAGEAASVWWYGACQGLVGVSGAHSVRDYVGALGGSVNNELGPEEDDIYMLESLGM